MTEIIRACGAEMVLLGTVVLLILAETVWPRQGGRTKAYLSLMGVALAFLALAFLNGPPPDIFQHAWINDRMSVVFKVVLLLATSLAIFISIDDVTETSRASAEFFILLLLAAVGMMIMVSGRDLLVIYLGLELMAISFYILAGFYWFRGLSSEGALKYVLTGLFGSALLIYGVSFLYGVSGTTDLIRMNERLSTGGPNDFLVLIGIALVGCGLAFKMGAAPFHMWMPDVLEGAPTSVAAYLAVGPKIAVLAIAARIFLTGLSEWQGAWEPLLWSLAALTILWGNLAAIAQAGIKRMLAYSSIAHVGYLLIALVAAGPEIEAGMGAIAFYLVVYAFMNIGAFGALLWFERQTGETVTWKDLAGMYRRAPFMSMVFALFLFSLAGIPPTAGFIGKFWIFLAAWKAGFTWLVLIGVLGSLIGAFYYLRVIYAIYMMPEEEERVFPSEFSALVYAVALSALGVILTGVYPEFFMALARQAVP